MATPLVERYGFDRLPTDLRLSRIGAAGLSMVTCDVDELLCALGVEVELTRKARRRLARGLAQFARVRATREDVLRKWEMAFWGDVWPPPTREELVHLEMERRECSRRCFEPKGTIGFLASEPCFSALNFDIPSPSQLTAKWARELVNPALMYSAPEELPSIEGSREVPGPVGIERMIRFRSPSRLGDIVNARVFEPEERETIRGTFIYVSGLFAACDEAVYWPEEEYVGRALAVAGYRVVLLEPPFHGRRAPAGRASGETCLATAPVGIFQFLAAAVQEMAVLVAWARKEGSRVVGVGGMNLGALAVQQFAGRAKSFPRGMRPDMVFLAGASNQCADLLLDAPIAQNLGLSQAILEAGWTREALVCLRELLDPPAEPALAPNRIFAVVGAEDAFLPFSPGHQLLRKWQVPPDNVTILPTGHFGLLAHLVRHSDTRLTITRGLHRASPLR